MNTQSNPEVFEDSPAIDPAKPILPQAPELADQMRETLWEVFHHASDHLQLAKVLDNFSASNDTKHRLWTAKKMTAPMVDPVHEVRKAIEGVSQMDPAVLAAAEAHPTVLKALTDSMIPKSKAKA